MIESIAIIIAQNNSFQLQLYLLQNKLLVNLQIFVLINQMRFSQYF